MVRPPPLPFNPVCVLKLEKVYKEEMRERMLALNWKMPELYVLLYGIYKAACISILFCCVTISGVMGCKVFAHGKNIHVICVPNAAAGAGRTEKCGGCGVNAARRPYKRKSKATCISTFSFLANFASKQLF